MTRILKHLIFGTVYAITMGCVIFTITELFDLPSLLITPIVAFTGVSVVNRVGSGFGMTPISLRKRGEEQSPDS